MFALQKRETEIWCGTDRPSRPLQEWDAGPEFERYSEFKQQSTKTSEMSKCVEIKLNCVCVCNKYQDKSFDNSQII